MSNLTVSYVSQTPPGAPAGPSAAAAPADSPLGFLTALIDQLLAGGSKTPGTGMEAGANATVAGLLEVDFGTEITAEATELASSLLASLSTQLDQLGQPGAADVPTSDQLPNLQAVIDALIAALDAATSAPAPQASVAGTVPPTIAPAEINQLLTDLGLIAPVTTKEAQPATIAAQLPAPVDISALRERLTALSQSVAATAPELAQKLATLAAKLEPVATDPALAAQLGLATSVEADPDTLTIAHIIRSLLGHGTPATDADEPPSPQQGQTQAQDDLLRVLAALGLSTTATSSAGTDVTATATTVPAPLLRLSNQLTQVASELAPTAPELAKKLETIATRIVSGEADANLLGKLTSAAAEPNGTSLDKLVQSLIDAKPAPAPTPVPAAPQIAAPKELAIPAPIAPKQSKSAVAEVKAAPPGPTPVTADSAPKPAPSVTLQATARETSDAAPPKVEAKVATIVAEATRSDPANQPTQPQPQQPAPAAAQQARALPAAYQPVANPINMGQVAFEMVRQVHQGMSRFTIRLDPPELGRVDVKMHVDNTGTVNARLTVDRAETLDLFQRDRQQLERALAQAGLDTSRTNLEFNLRQQSHNPFAGMMGGDQHQQHPGYGGAPPFSPADADEAASMPAVTLYRGTASAGGVNIFA